jgi:signal transduction histidine kinase
MHFLKNPVREPVTESKDIVVDDERMKSTIASDPVLVNGRHFWTVFIVAPHYLASDVIALFSRHNNISILVIVMITSVACSMALIIISWNKWLVSLVNARTRELQLKSEELNRANESLAESNKQILSINQLLSSSNDHLLEANKKLEIQDKMQKDFINIAAHDLRTPIMPILGGLEFLGDKLGDDAKENVKEEISMIRRNAERLHKLAEDIL